MKKFLFLLLLLPTLGWAQGSLTWSGLRGQALDQTIALDSAWTDQTASVQLFAAPGGTPYPATVQPTLTRSTISLSVHLSASQTAKLPNTTYVEVTTGGILRYTGYLYLGSLSTSGGNPNSVVSWDFIAGKPTIPSSASQLGAVSLSQYTTERAADISKIDQKPTYVANVASLTGLSRGSVTSVYLQEIGREGNFVYDPTLMSFDGAMSIPALGGGGWRRLFSGYVNVKWFGAKGDGVTDDTEAFQKGLNYAAFNGAGDGRNRTLFVPAGVYRVSAELWAKQQTLIQGEGLGAGGSEIHFYGPADARSCLYAGSPNGAAPGQSMVSIRNLRIVDKRTAPTTGWGIYINNVDNRSYINECLVYGFPQGQIYVGAPSGQSSDCVEIHGTWVLGTTANTIGILLERLDNNIVVNTIYSDLRGGGAVIQIQNIGNDAATISLQNIKHEDYDGQTKTIYLPDQNHGNISIKNVVQRTPSTTNGYDIVTFGPSAAYSNRVTLENITGDAHNTWGSGAATVNCLAFNEKVYGPISYAVYGGGRVRRILTDTGNPEGTRYGNAGDIFQRTDGITSAASFWVKASGSGTNTNWTPLRYSFESLSTQTIAVTANSYQSFTVPSTGAATLDFAQVNIEAAIPDGVLISSVVSASNTVKVTIYNASTAAWNPGTVTIRTIVTRRAAVN